jgi:hypothetical protein
MSRGGVFVNIVSFNILIAAILLVVIFLVFFSSKSSAIPLNQTTINFQPDPQNDKVIITEGWDASQLNKILADFQNIYKRDGYPPYSIDITQLTTQRYKLTFPKDIHPLLFSFLINYLAYPMGFDVQHRTVAGEMTMNFSFGGLEPQVLGQKAILYIPEDDQAHVVVYLHASSGANLVMTFSNLIWSTTDIYKPNSVVQYLHP